MKVIPAIQTRYHSFDEYASAEHGPGLSGQVATQLMTMYRKVIEKTKPTILELGTDKGQATTIFLQACEDTGGRLVSVDIRDCSDVSDSPRWKFVQSDSVDVEFVLSQAPFLKEGIDVLYVDSVHTREHVECELMGWYAYMNEHAWIFFDDVDPNPYRKGNRKDGFLAELAWSEVREYVEAFFYANEDRSYLNMLYGSTGLACLYKLSPLGTVPEPARPIIHRRKTALNMLRYKPRLLPSLIKRRLLR